MQTDQVLKVSWKFFSYVPQYNLMWVSFESSLNSKKVCKVNLWQNECELLCCASRAAYDTYILNLLIKGPRVGLQATNRKFHKSSKAMPYQCLTKIKYSALGVRYFLHSIKSL